MGLFNRKAVVPDKGPPYVWQTSAPRISSGVDMAAFVVPGVMQRALEGLSQRSRKLPSTWSLSRYTPVYDPEEERRFLGSLNEKDYARYTTDGEEYPYDIVCPIGGACLVTAEGITDLFLMARAGSLYREGPMRDLTTGRVEQVRTAAPRYWYQFRLSESDRRANRTETAQRLVDAVDLHGLL